MDKKKRDAATDQVRAFYDGPADTIYRETWGKNLHLGVPREPTGSYEDAIEHATELMASHAPLGRARAYSILAVDMAVRPHSWRQHLGVT